MLSTPVLLLSLATVTLIRAQTVAEQQQNDQIPAWYQMAKPAQQAQAARNAVAGVSAQASPSYYERIEAPTYETRREQTGYERQGIQTNQYANYPTYQNRQPYDNLNALTGGASLSNLQQTATGRRYPSSLPIQAAGNDNQSAIKRYHKLLLKRRQWTTKIPRILAKSTTWQPATTPVTTTEEPTTTTTQKMPKSLKSIYSTILPKAKKEEVITTSEPSTTRKVVRASTRPPLARTFKPYGTRKGWRMWKKATTSAPTTSTSTTTTTTEEPTTTEEVTTTTSTTTEEPTTTTTEEITTLATTEEPTTTTTEEVTTETLVTEESTAAVTEALEITTTSEPQTTTEELTTTTTEEPSTTTTQGPLRPIVVGTHSWKPLRFKKPQNLTTTTTGDLTGAPKGLKLLEYLLPNTELLAAIKDVVAKFKASLDEAGIDQDVRQMGNQLKNTWQQLRTGTNHQQGLDRGMSAVRKSAETSIGHFQFGNAERQPPVQPQPLPVQIPYQQHYQYPVTASSKAYTPGPMNEQLGKLFEKAVADAADLKQSKPQQNQ